MPHNVLSHLRSPDKHPAVHELHGRKET